jgi:hypothetical protein
MTSTSSPVTGRRRALDTGTGHDRPGPLVWQRTDTVGTELVFAAGGDPRTATGSAVVAGAPAYATRWHAELDADSRVRALTVACDGGDWSRTLELARDRDGAWTCHTKQPGDLGPSHHAMPLPGIEDSARLHPQAIVRLSDLTPSLAVLPGISTYQLVGDHRLRVSGDEPAAGYELDHAGIVTYQPARLRLAR